MTPREHFISRVMNNPMSRQEADAETRFYGDCYLDKEDGKVYVYLNDWHVLDEGKEIKVHI